MTQMMTCACTFGYLFISRGRRRRAGMHAIERSHWTTEPVPALTTTKESHYQSNPYILPSQWTTWWEKLRHVAERHNEWTSFTRSISHFRVSEYVMKTWMSSGFKRCCRHLTQTDSEVNVKHVMNVEFHVPCDTKTFFHFVCTFATKDDQDVTKQGFKLEKLNFY